MKKQIKQTRKSRKGLSRNDFTLMLLLIAGAVFVSLMALLILLEL